MLETATSGEWWLPPSGGKQKRGVKEKPKAEKGNKSSISMFRERTSSLLLSTPRIGAS
jgi:hypothetical protein